VKLQVIPHSQMQVPRPRMQNGESAREMPRTEKTRENTGSEIPPIFPEDHQKAKETPMALSASYSGLTSARAPTIAPCPSN
jgi:hypothetical protein